MATTEYLIPFNFRAPLYFAPLFFAPQIFAQPRKMLIRAPFIFCASADIQILDTGKILKDRYM